MHFLFALIALVGHNKIVSLLLVTSIVSTMPEPGAKLDRTALYAWFYAWAHQFPNLVRPALTPLQQRLLLPAPPEPKDSGAGR